MMKWITLIISSFLLASCYTTTEVIEYRQVTVAPVVETISVDYDEPIDVTTTTIDFY